MKMKRFLLLFAVFSLIGTATVFADDAMDWYKGKKVRIVINKKELKSDALIIDSKTMVPIGDLADSMQAIVKWDGDAQTVNIYKPNVHMFLYEVAKDKIKGTFGNVNKGKYDFVVFAQVDNLLTNIYSLKITIEDPYGKVIETDEKKIKDQKDNFWYTTPTLTEDFKYTGDYIVKLYMKTKEDEGYTLMSSKVIQSLPDES